jgi:hypothetical protein
MGETWRVYFQRLRQSLLNSSSEAENMNMCDWAVTRFSALALLLSAIGAGNAEASALWASGGGTLSLTPINATNGAVGPVMAITGVTRALSDLAGQGSLVWGISGGFGDGPLVAMDPVTKQIVSSISIAPKFTAAQSIESLAIDPLSGEIYGATSTNLYRISPATGMATLVGATALPVDKALGFDAGGNLYGIGNHNRLVVVDKSTGGTSLVAALAVQEMEDIAVQPETGVMYGIGYGPNYSLYQINLTNGALVNVGPSLLRPTGLAFATVPEPNAAILAMIALPMAVCFARTSSRNCFVSRSETST